MRKGVNDGARIPLECGSCVPVDLDKHFRLDHSTLVQSLAKIVFFTIG